MCEELASDYAAYMKVDVKSEVSGLTLTGKHST